MSLERHEALLDMEDAVPNIRNGVKFSSTAPNSTTVVLDVVRWIDMGNPRQIKVTVEPVAKDEKPDFDAGPLGELGGSLRRLNDFKGIAPSQSGDVLDDLWYR